MHVQDDRDQFAPPRPPARLRAALLALLAHAVLIVALTWGVNWKSSSDQPAMQAELWSAVPQQAAPRATAPPTPPVPPEPPAPAPAPPKPAPAPTPPPPPPAPPRQAEPDTREADIAIEREKKRLEKEKKAQQQREREQREKERKEDERRERLEDEKKERLQKEKQDKAAQQKAEREKAERAKAEQAKAEREKIQAEKDRQEKAEKQKQQAEDKKRQAAQAAQDKAKQEALEKASAKASEERRLETLRRLQGLAGASGGETASGNAKQDSGPSGGYGGKVAAKVKPNIVYPDAVAGNPRAVVQVRAAPDGTIVGKKLVQSSGNKGWDDAVLRALDKTETLPRDIDGRVPASLEIGFRPQD